MSKSRSEAWLTLAVLAIGGLLIAVIGLWAFMVVTAVPLHPNASDVPSTGSGAPSSGWHDAAEEGRRIVRAALTEQNLPGLSVAVGAGQQVVWAEGFGWADIEKREPVAPETIFRTGTLSKALTSAAVGLLLEDGRLKLDDDIQSYVPAFPRASRPVTLRQLMADVSGIRNDGGDEGPLFTVHCERPADALPYFAQRPLLFEPGTQRRTSSYGWILVSAAVEAAAGEPFLAFMKEKVFTPAGMSATRPDSATTAIPNRATLYFPRFAADPHYGLHLMRPLDYSCYAGASVFLSTPSDLVRFALALDAGSLLRPDTVLTLQTSQRLQSGQETGYGLGWKVETVDLAGRQTRRAGYDGMSLGGMAAALAIYPDRDLAVAVLANISYADTAGVASRIAEAFASRSNGSARN